MKLIHISDLHLGKRLHGFSLIEDQAEILEQILQIVRSEAPDAVLIAGDVYDRTQPSVEAVRLLDHFLVGLSATGTTVCLISGNHDAPERLAFGADLMKKDKVFIAPVYDGMCQSSLSQKGIEVGVSYTPIKNVLATFIYFNGKDIGVTEDRKTQQLYGCLDFFF